MTIIRNEVTLLMKMLVVAATQAEIGPFLSAGTDADVLITGVGPVATTYALTRHLARAPHYDFVIQAGVAGSFDTGIRLGEVVLIISDTWGDVGAEDHADYLSIFDLGLLGRDEPPYTAGVLPLQAHAISDSITLRRTTGITVSTVSGSEATIARRRLTGAGTESMEGAAFHYVCLREQVPFVQIRAISNYVIPRDKSQWRMKDAIINLNDWLINFTRAHAG